jgi:hypothetical protein
MKQKRPLASGLFEGFYPVVGLFLWWLSYLLRLNFISHLL